MEPNRFNALRIGLDGHAIRNGALDKLPLDMTGREKDVARIKSKAGHNALSPSSQGLEFFDANYS